MDDIIETMVRHFHGRPNVVRPSDRNLIGVAARLLARQIEHAALVQQLATQAAPGRLRFSLPALDGSGMALIIDHQPGHTSVRLVKDNDSLAIISGRTAFRYGWYLVMYNHRVICVDMHNFENVLGFTISMSMVGHAG
jgi:hypothetical protein